MYKNWVGRYIGVTQYRLRTGITGKHDRGIQRSKTPTINRVVFFEWS
ncbi:MAG: hypothetical protein QXI32_04555 [Candidatus Bathyarchaeia archaeon]